MRRRRVRGVRGARPPYLGAASVITLRLSGPGPDAGLERLAQLADRPRQSGPALIAEVDGEPWAALVLASRLVLADPFRPSGEIVPLLRLRAARIAA
jgi:hypothetical protein